jgi:lipid-A-disaccharide synthase-like uncharacterized protein
MTLSGETLWISIGIAGQALFGARFFVQWLYSESHGRSLIPRTFWYFSVAGGAVLLAYAIHRREPVFIAGESFTLAIFLRNLHMVRREARMEREESDMPQTPADKS